AHADGGAAITYEDLLDGQAYLVQISVRRTDEMARRYPGGSHSSPQHGGSDGDPVSVESAVGGADSTGRDPQPGAGMEDGVLPHCQQRRRTDPDGLYRRLAARGRTGGLFP